MIRLESVTFTYPQASRPALENINLHVRPGEFLLVTGESGSGKSTLLRVPNGLVPQFTGGSFAGRVIVDGRDLTGHPPRDAASTIGFVPQDPTAHATADHVVADIAFTMENLGVKPALMRKRIEEVLDALSIAHLRDRKLSTLSGGERQRVAIASVLAAQPRVLICDEPTSALDPKSAEDVLSSLVRLRDDLGLTIICSEHRLERLGSFADRVLHLQSGRTQVLADTREAFEQIPHVPAVSEIGRRLGWRPLPVTVREARSFAREMQRGLPIEREHSRGAEVLVAENLRAGYSGREVLKSASITLFAGEITALVGRNGSGKTTLVRTLAGIHPLKSGRIRIDGKPIGRDAGRHVAYVPQRAEALLFRDSVRAEVESAAGDQAGTWLEKLDLLDVADRHPWDISAGQRLRVALATALSRRASAILLDEPTRGLDASGKSLLCDLLTLRSGQGTAILLVTHDVELVARVAQRVCLLGDGEIVADGEVTDVLGESILFSSQTSRVMGDSRFLTPDDVAPRP